MYNRIYELRNRKVPVIKNNDLRKHFVKSPTYKKFRFVHVENV